MSVVQQLEGRTFDLHIGQFVLCKMTECVSEDFYSHVYHIAQSESEPCMVQHIISFDCVHNYDNFIQSMDCHPWIEGYGGYDSIRSLDKQFDDFNEEEKKLFWDNSYRCLVAVECFGRETVFLDPQGYDSPKYVGLLAC